MKRLIAVVVCAALSGASARAGGPVVVVEEPPPVVEEGTPSSKAILPWLMVPLVLCIIMCGQEEDAE